MKLSACLPHFALSKATLNVTYWYSKEWICFKQKYIQDPSASPNCGMGI